MAEMIKLAQAIKTPNGEEMVLLPKAAFDELRRVVAEAEEDDDDIAIYDARKADSASSTALPADVTIALLKGERRIKALRKWKGMTQQQLSHAAGISQGHLSDLETGRRVITAETARTMARVLLVPLAWIEA